MQIPATPRLRFQLMSAADANLLFDVDQDEQVMLYINGGHKSSWQDIEQRMLPRMNAYRDPQLGYGIYAVFATRALQRAVMPHETALPALARDSAQGIAEGTYLGWILVRPMNFFTTGAEHDNLELGWRFKRHCWGLGIASEAAAAVAHSVVAQRTSTSPVHALSAIALPENLASIGVMKKLGMQYVKRYIHQDPLGSYDVVLYRRQLSPAS